MIIIEIQRLKNGYLYQFRSIYQRYFRRDFPLEKVPDRKKGWGKEFMAQRNLRLKRRTPSRIAKPTRRQKDQYASNPDIDASRSKLQFSHRQTGGQILPFHSNCIEQAGCRIQRQHPVCGYAHNRQPGFSRQVPKEIQAFFPGAADFLIDRVGRRKISCRQWYTWTRKHPTCI